LSFAPYTTAQSGRRKTQTGRSLAARKEMTQETEDQVFWSITLDCQPEFLLAVDGLLIVSPAVPPPNSPEYAPTVYALRLSDGVVAWQQAFPYVMVSGMNAQTRGARLDRRMRTVSTWLPPARICCAVKLS